jgi:uncharacterized protein (DUF1330 family)
MSTYVIVTEKVEDETTFESYRRVVPETLAAHGGKFVVRGADFEVVEGQWPMPRLVIIEFPTREAAKAWYNSPEYQKVLPLRLKSSVGNMVMVDTISRP